MRFDSSPECSRCCGCQGAGPSAKAAPLAATGTAGPASDAATGVAAPLKAALLLYVVPLALFFTGYATGSTLALEFGFAPAAPAIGATVGVLLFFGAFGVLRLALSRRSG